MDVSSSATSFHFEIPNDSENERCEAELRKIPLTIVIGDKEVSDRTVSIRKHGNKMSEVKSIDAFVEDIVIAVQEKAL